MKMTLLEMVQYILSDIDSDEVDSISDTFESEQVARIIRTVYMSWMSKSNWPHLKTLMSLSPFSDPLRPTHMRLPERVSELESVRYEGTLQDLSTTYYKNIEYKTPEEFLFITNQFNPKNVNTQSVMDPSGVKIRVMSHQDPSFFTSFDDEVLVFDSYNKAVDDSLQESKFQVHAYRLPTFIMEDDFVPDLPAEAFAGLYNEALSTAAMRIAQSQDVKAEREAQRQRYWMARKNWRVEGGIEYPNYGRKRRK